MAIINQTALEDAFGVKAILGLSDKDRNGTVDTKVIDAAIAWAEEKVYSHLRKVIKNDDIATNVFAIQIATDLAYFQLHKITTETMDEGIRIDYYDGPLHELRMAAKGMVDVGDPADVTEIGLAESTTRTSDKPGFVSGEALAGY